MNALAYVEPAPADEFDLDEPTRPDLTAALPMRALVFGTIAPAINNTNRCFCCSAFSEGGDR